MSELVADVFPRCLHPKTDANSYVNNGYRFCRCCALHRQDLRRRKFDKARILAKYATK